MNNNLDLAKAFGQYIGLEIPMIVEEQEHKGKKYPIMRLSDENDPTIAAMRQTANDNGLKLRLWWPGICDLNDWRIDRVNVHIVQDDDGKWRISPKFEIG